MGAVDPIRGGTRDALIGLYAVIMGSLMCIYEWKYKLTARDLRCFRVRFPVHGLIYFILCLPLFVARGTVLFARPPFSILTDFLFICVD
jgi:hypothetical protein